MKTTITIREIKCLADGRNERQRQRTVPSLAVGAEVTLEEGAPVLVAARIGGTVPNNYGYRASTQALCYVVDRTGRAVVAYATIPANKATTRGAARATIPEAAPLFDGRTGAERDAAAQEACTALLEHAYGTCCQHADCAENPELAADCYAARNRIAV